MNNKLPIDFFLSLKLVFSVNSSANRIEKETRILQRLLRSEDFLSRYNLAIRYVFLVFLKNGYDVMPSKVHPCFREYCIRVLNFEREIVQQIIKARHSNKYLGVRPSRSIGVQLDKIILLLSDFP